MIKMLKRLSVTVLLLALFSPTAKAEFAHAYCSSILSNKIMLNVGNLTDEEYRELLVAGFEALNEKYGQVTIKLFKRDNPEADKILTEALGMPMTIKQFYELLPHSVYPIPEVYRRLKAGTLSPRHKFRLIPPKLKKPSVDPSLAPTAPIESFTTFAPVNPPEVKPAPPAPPSPTVLVPPPTKPEAVVKTKAAPQAKPSARKARPEKSADTPVKFETQFASTDQEQRDFVKRILTSLYQAGKKPTMAYLYTLETRADPDLGSKVINGVMYGYSGSLYDALVDAKLNPRHVFDMTEGTRPLSPGTLLFKAQQAQTFRKPPELLRQTAQAIGMEFTFNDIALTRVIVYELLRHPTMDAEQLYVACEESTKQPIDHAEFKRVLRDVSRNYTLYAFLNNLMHSN